MIRAGVLLVILLVAAARQNATAASSIDRARLRTVIAADGRIVTYARYLLTNEDEALMEIDVGNDAAVWRVKVDGAPKTAGKSGIVSVLIPETGNGGASLVEIVYARAGERLRRNRHTVTLTAPIVNYSARSVEWEVLSPQQYRVASAESNLREVARLKHGREGNKGDNGGKPAIAGVSDSIEHWELMEPESLSYSNLEGRHFLSVNRIRVGKKGAGTAAVRRLSSARWGGLIMMDGKRYFEIMSMVNAKRNPDAPSRRTLPNVPSSPFTLTVIADEFTLPGAVLPRYYAQEDLSLRMPPVITINLAERHASPKYNFQSVVVALMLGCIVSFLLRMSLHFHGAPDQPFRRLFAFILFAILFLLVSFEAQFPPEVRAASVTTFLGLIIPLAFKFICGNIREELRHE